MSFRLSWPNRITFARILLIPLFVLALVQAREGDPLFRWVGLALLVLVCAGDALDGYLARRLHSRSRLGALLDPLADKLLMTAGYLLLSFMSWPEPTIPKWVAVIVISRDVLMVVFFLALVTLGTKFHQVAPSFLGKLCTAFQMSTLVATLSAPGFEAVLGGDATRMFLAALFFITAWLTIVTGIDYLYAARTQLGSPESAALIESDDPDENPAA